MKSLDCYTCFIIFASPDQNRSQISLIVSTKKCLLTVIYSVIPVSNALVFTARTITYTTTMFYLRVICERLSLEISVIFIGSRRVG